MRNLLKQSPGFTLIELMVAIVVVGIMATIAISDYTKFVERAHQAEAKIALSAIYTAEMTASAEVGSFTNCLAQMGFTPNAGNRYYAVGFGGEPLEMTCGQRGVLPCLGYYFPSDANAGICFSCGPSCWTCGGCSGFCHFIFTTSVAIVFSNNILLCRYAIDQAFNTSLANSDIEFSASMAAGPYQPQDSDLAAVTTVSGSSFVAGAVGNISSQCASASCIDSWAIDETKSIIQTQNGL